MDALGLQLALMEAYANLTCVQIPHKVFFFSPFSPPFLLCSLCFYVAVSQSKKRSHTILKEDLLRHQKVHGEQGHCGLSAALAVTNCLYKNEKGGGGLLIQ